MPEQGDTRVAVYLDFDNIVISRYDQVHGRQRFSKDKVRTAGREPRSDIADKLAAATVDVGAIIDFASSFGTLVLTRAYADWSADVNADYRGQLVGRAVDLVQLFPAAAYGKNGADIRLAVDAVEDMFRLPDLTHVVLVAGDSDYIALAQRCKRLGRYVVGVGVAGSTSRSLAAACDELVTYDALPGIDPIPAPEPEPTAPAAPGVSSADDITDGAADEVQGVDGAGSADGVESVTAPAKRKRATRKQTKKEEDDPQVAATRLLERALRLGHEKNDDEWLHSSAVKSQMKRMDPSFREKALGFRSFSDFVVSRDEVAELDDSSPARQIRARNHD